ncbi:MAG: TRAP transporter large permease subunit, partial [Pseudomonadota bacterium]
IMFYILRSKVWGPKFHVNGTNRPGVAGNVVVVFAKLLIGVGTASLIMIVIQQTGLANDLAQILVALVGESRAALILLVAMASIGLGLLMPALPAYLIAAALFGLALRTVGIDWLTAQLGLLTIIGTSPLIKWLVRRRSTPRAVQQSA